jgi:uncharacterized protein with ParB-like and HNH nuclease domain
MALGVKLESVANLLNKEFFIRSYQRGYRWDTDQLNDLMSDFKEFIDDQNKLEEEFYCLQPIVVKILTNDEKSRLERFNFQNDEIYEVIDGQQRITTIAILLHYLSEALKDKIRISNFPSITYEVREKSKEILSNFNNFILSDEKRLSLDDNIDFYHMQVVYAAIKEWFKTNNDYEISFLKILTSYKINSVKVIWYEVAESENSIKVFRRFNVGKIPLSNAELIKALFLKEDDQAQKAIKYSIAKEWQNIENQLQAEFFWGFLNPPKEYSSRIEYIFDLIFETNRNLKTDKSKEDFDKNYGTDKSKVFRFFLELINRENDLLAVWDKVNSVFEKFVQWFNHEEHYHYIGYLQNREGNRKSDNFILSILNYQDNKTLLGFQTKEALTDYLIQKINEKSRNWFKDKKLRLNYDSDKMELRNFFFLFHVETCVMLSLASKGESIYKLPFILNKANVYDIEHIDSKTDKDIDKLKQNEQLDLLKDLKTDFEFEIGESFKEMISPVFKNNSETDLWQDENIVFTKLPKILETILNKIEDLFSSESDLIIDRNVIGNLTILNVSINRSYGNSFFTTKRRIIINHDKKGIFIPVSTKNVFLKYYSGEIKKHTRWNQTDANNYQIELESKLSKFI